MVKPISLSDQATVNIDVSASSQSIQVTTTPGITQVRVMNNGTATAWIRWGTATGQAATIAASIPVGPGVTEVMSAGSPVSSLWVAAIAAGSTGKIYFTPGEGI